MKKFFSLLISLLILAFIYAKLSRHGQLTGLRDIFLQCDRFWMAVSLGMVVPLTMLTARRLQQLMPRAGQLPWGEANRLILVASVLNLVLPSKMGDLAKAYFMRDRGGLSGSLALSLVIFEKACDMLSLLLWCVFGLAWVQWNGGAARSAFRMGSWLHLPAAQQEVVVFWLAALVIGGSLALGLLLIGSPGFAQFFFTLGSRWAPGKLGARLQKLRASWGEMHAYFWASKRRLATVTLTSIFIWFLHLLQIWLFILALRAWAPFFANLALSPLAILAGLLPLGMAGVGTRDAALIFLYAPYFEPKTGAALGLLCTARYLLPALGGLPLVGQYLRRLRRERAAEAAMVIP